jgi:hypothetical protein
MVGDKTKSKNYKPIISVGPTTKMRVQLFNSQGHLHSDRLVEQEIELKKGPTEFHDGPVTIEATFFTQDEVFQITDYLQKLSGLLPITEKVKKPKKIKDDMLGDKSPVEDLLKEVKAKCKTQEELIEMLREKWDFRFVDYSFIEDYVPADKLKIKSETAGAIQYMARMYREAKEPANDKFDWRLVFGIAFLGERIDKVKIYLYGKFNTNWELPWDKPKVHNFKKVTPIYSFPEFMTYEERKKWRTENRKLQKDPNYEWSKQFERWTPYVKINGEKIELPKKNKDAKNNKTSKSKQV